MKTTINPNIYGQNYSYYTVKDTDTFDLMPFECGHETCAPDKKVIRTCYNYFALHVVIRGKGYYTIDEHTYCPQKNQIFAMFPGEKIEYYPDVNDPWEYYWINFVGIKAKHFMSLCDFTKQNPVFSFTNKAICDLFQKATELENLLSRDLLTVAILYEIFAAIFEERKKTIPGREKSGEQTLNDAIKYIDDNLHNPSLQIADVAKYLSYNKKYFAELFKKKTGLTFSKYLCRIRIIKSCEYIERTNMSVKEIAALVGFSDPLYFTKKFNEIMFIPPTVYRTNYRKN